MTAKTLPYKVVLATVGSLVDLHPFIALGRALNGLGVSVMMACAAEYQNKVEAAGLMFYPLRPSFEDMQRDLGRDRTQLVRDAVRYTDFLLRKMILPYTRTAYEDMLQATADADLVLSSGLAFGARLAAEKRGIPWIAVVLQPMMFFSSYDPPIIHNAEWLSTLLRQWGPIPTRYAIWAFKKALYLWVRPVHKFRVALGLPPTAQNPLFEGQFMSAGAIGLYSELLGKVQPDYPQRTSVVGFAIFDSEDGQAAKTDADLEAFLEAGAPPLVFTLGSLIIHIAGNFYSESVKAARALKKRAVLLVGEQAIGQLTHLRSTEVFVCAYAPHSLLFSRAAAVVHHGGIGTLGQALRAGRPQLIVPYFADQIDNAARAIRLGVARMCKPHCYSSVSASHELSQLLEDGRYRARACAVGDSLMAEDGAGQAARIVLDRLQQLERK